MTVPPFDPRASVAVLGSRAVNLVETIAAGRAWTPGTLRAASEEMERRHSPRLAKRLHLLAAIWAVNHHAVQDRGARA